MDVDEQKLAEFIDGVLDEDERAEVLEAIVFNEELYEIFVETVRYLDIVECGSAVHRHPEV